MPPLVADYPILRWGILLGLFALVAIGAYLGTVAISARQMSRRRLADGSDFTEHAIVGASLRSTQRETAWVKLVNGIEKAVSRTSRVLMVGPPVSCSLER